MTMRLALVATISTLVAGFGLEPAEAAPLRPAIAEAPDVVLADGRRHHHRHHHRDHHRHWGHRPHHGYYGHWYAYPRYYAPPPYYAPRPYDYYPPPRYYAPPPGFHFYYRN